MKYLMNIASKLSIFVLFSALTACQEEQRGQFPIDNTPPEPVTALRQESQFGGGVKIRYDLPDDRNMLYVVARYTLDTGREMEVKASVYNTSMDIVGFSHAQERTIEVRTVSRSQVESEPQTLVVHPLRSPIHDVFESLEMMNDFGGIRVLWKNEARAPINVLVSTPVEGSSLMEQAGNFASSMMNGRGNVRGYKEEPRLFYVRVRDRWGNVTEANVAEYVPIHEEEIDKLRFRRWNLDAQIPYSSNGWNIEGLWDDVGSCIDGASNNAFHTADPNPSRTFLPVAYEFGPAIIQGGSFTFDMGSPFTLSRLAIYHRGGTWPFRHHNPKKYAVYGSLTSNAKRANDDLAPINWAEGTAKWIFLGYWDDSDKKPSGLPLGSITAEDERAANCEGMHNDFPMEHWTPVRYIRFDCIESWGVTPGIHMNELTFWGRPHVVEQQQ